MNKLNEQIRRAKNGEKDYEVTSDAASKFRLKVTKGAFEKFLAYRDFYQKLSGGDIELYTFQACRPDEDFTRDIILGHRQEENTSTFTSLAMSSDRFAGGAVLTADDIEKNGMTIRGWAHVHPFQHSGKPHPSGTDRGNNERLLYSRQGSPTCRKKLYEYENLITQTSFENGKLMLHNRHTGQDYIFELPKEIDPSKIIIPKLVIRNPVEDTFIWSMIINGRSRNISDAYVEYLTQRISRLGETSPSGPTEIPSAELITVPDDIAFDEKGILVEIMKKIDLKRPLIHVCDNIPDKNLQEAVREEVKNLPNYAVQKRKGYWIFFRQLDKPRVRRKYGVSKKNEAILEELGNAKAPYLPLLKLKPGELEALIALKPEEIELLKKSALEKAVDTSAVQPAPVKYFGEVIVQPAPVPEKISWYQSIAASLRRIWSKMQGRTYEKIPEQMQDYEKPISDEKALENAIHGIPAVRRKEQETSAAKEKDTLGKAREITNPAVSGNSYEAETLRKGENKISDVGKIREAAADDLAQHAFDRAREIRENKKRNGNPK